MKITLLCLTNLTGPPNSSAITTKTSSEMDEEWFLLGADHPAG